MYRAAQIPGPADYEAPAMNKGAYAISGGVLSTAQPKTAIEWDIYRASFIPASWDCQPEGGFSSLNRNGGVLSTSKAKSNLEWEMYRAEQLPGPADYMPDFPEIKGGVISTSKPKSFAEWEMYRASQIPGPSDYDVPGMVERMQQGSHNIVMRMSASQSTKSLGARKKRSSK